MAFHGGSLEAGTDTIASAIAERSGASLYSVIQPPGFRWHVPSKLVDPAASDSLTNFLDHVEVVIAVHGFGRAGLFTSLLLGGGNRELATHVGAALREHLAGYEIIDKIEAIPAELRGLHSDNPVNLPRAGGLQLELPPRVRGLGPFWSDRTEDGFTPHTEALIAGVVAAIGTWKPA